MNKYSVWRFPYNKPYLWKHPIKLIKCIGQCFADAWRRSVYGWTYGDAWDWYEWFLHVTPDMLRKISNDGVAFPGHEPFETAEKWRDWLQHMAYLIETADETWQDEHNEYYEEYINTPMHRKLFNTDIVNKYSVRAGELAEQGKKNIELAMTELGKHFYDIWD